MCTISAALQVKIECVAHFCGEIFRIAQFSVTAMCQASHLQRKQRLGDLLTGTVALAFPYRKSGACAGASLQIIGQYADHPIKSMC